MQESTLEPGTVVDDGGTLSRERDDAKKPSLGLWGREGKGVVWRVVRAALAMRPSLGSFGLEGVRMARGASLLTGNLTRRATPVMDPWIH